MSDKKIEVGCRAFVALNSWAGKSYYAVTILSETPKRFKVQWEQNSFGHKKGSISYVPKRAVITKQITNNA